jgi:hypothetical protein
VITSNVVLAQSAYLNPFSEPPTSAFSSPGEEISGPFMLQAEMLSPSATFKFLMNVQLALILFLELYWLYEQV